MTHELLSPIEPRNRDEATWIRRVSLLITTAIVIPVLYIGYSLCFPQQPRLVLCLSNRVETVFVVAYFMLPLGLLVTTKFGLYMTSWKRNLMLVWAFSGALIGFSFGVWRSGISDGYRNPDFGIEDTVVEDASYSLRYYRSVAGSYLMEERVLFPWLKSTRQLLFSRGDIKTRLISPKEIEWETSDGHRGTSNLYGV